MVDRKWRAANEVPPGTELQWHFRQNFQACRRNFFQLFFSEHAASPAWRWYNSNALSICITGFPTQMRTFSCNNVRLSDVKWKGIFHTIPNCSCPRPVLLGLHRAISFKVSESPSKICCQGATSPAWAWSSISTLHGLHMQVFHTHCLANHLKAE